MENPHRPAPTELTDYSLDQGELERLGLEIEDLCQLLEGASEEALRAATRVRRKHAQAQALAQQGWQLVCEPRNEAVCDLNTFGHFILKDQVTPEGVAPLLQPN